MATNPRTLAPKTSQDRTPAAAPPSPVSAKPFGDPAKREGTLRRSISPIAVVVLTVACVSVTGQMEKVRVTSNPDVVRGCKFLGNVSFSGFWRVSPKDSENLFRKKVVELGGNVGFVTNVAAGKTAISGAAYSGEAYMCTAPSAPPAPSATPGNP
jgi:hypothetical protein